MSLRLIPLRARMALGVALSLQLIAGTAAPAISRAETVRDQLWVTDGEVRAVAYKDNTVFIGGAFSRVGPAIGGFATFDAASGSSVLPFVGVAGTVNAILPDGSGGYYLGGSFTGIKGQTRNNLAHIDGSGVALSWNPDVTGTVDALAIRGSTVYVGGTFTQVGGQARSNLAAFDATTGALLPWSPNPNGAVKSFASSATRLFVGGFFHSIAGGTRHLVASFDVASGALETWAPNGNTSGGSIYAIALYGNSLYVGGAFSVMSGQLRVGLAAVDITTGAASSWGPSVGGTVLAIAVTAINSIPTPIPTFWIAGNFSSVGGVGRIGLAAVDDAGTVLSFNPAPNGPVHAMQLRTNAAGFVTSFFVAGDFTSMGGLSRPYIASITGSGAVNTWDPVPTGPVYALAPGSGTIVAGGAFYSANMDTRAHLAALDASTGVVTPFNPGVDGPVNALLIHGRMLMVGGAFNLIATSARTSAAEINIDNYSVSAYSLQLDCTQFLCGAPTVYAIARDEVTNTVYLGGSFSGANGQFRHNIVATNGTTGAPTAFDVNANFPVRALFIRENAIIPFHAFALYAGGDFNRVNAGLFNAPTGGTIRYGLVALNPTTGEAAAGWDPSPNTTTTVNALAFTSTGPVDPGIIWAGGQFQSMGGQPRNNLAAVGGVSGVVTAWDPNADGIVRAMLLGPTGITLGGDFTTIGGQLRNHLACVDVSAGAPTSWNPDASGNVLALASNGGMIFAGGGYSQVSRYAHPFLAGIGDGVVTAVDEEPVAPAAPHAVNAAPNPTGGHTSFRFTLTRREAATVAVYDVTGRLVRTLHHGVLGPGTHTLEWNGNDAAERPAASGIYFCRVETPSVRMGAKVLRIR